MSSRKISPMNSDSLLFEFDESDLWISNSETTKKSIPNSRSSKKLSKMMISPTNPTPIPTTTSMIAKSLPVGIPDWSKILRDGSGEKGRRREINEDFEDVGYGGGDDGDDDGCYGKIPPHEYLARTRRASLSVHEGIGRTLKGRDLSRVRNAIWKKIGFED